MRGAGVQCAGPVRCVDGVDGIAIAGEKIDTYAGASGVTWRAIDPRHLEPQGAWKYHSLWEIESRAIAGPAPPAYWGKTLHCCRHIPPREVFTPPQWTLARMAAMVSELIPIFSSRSNSSSSLRIRIVFSNGQRAEASSSVI